jgi:hypothetical protein
MAPDSHRPTALAPWLHDEVQAELETALASARLLLGDRLDDLVYRSATEFLEKIDQEHAVWARPISQPPARFWLVERPDEGPADRPAELAFEDERGDWWIWEPKKDHFHNATPGVATDFYYRAGARIAQWIDEGFGRFRFTRLSIEQTLGMLDGETLRSGSDALLLPYLEGRSELTIAQAAEQVGRTSRAD